MKRMFGYKKQEEKNKCRALKRGYTTVANVSLYNVRKNEKEKMKKSEKREERRFNQD